MSSAPRHAGRRALLAALLACALTASATAQHPSPLGSVNSGGNSGQDDQVSTAMVALLAAVVAVFVFIAASIVYLRHCSGYNYNDAAASSWWRSPAGNDNVPGLDFSSRSWWQMRRRRRGSSRGLDAEAIEAFPTMTYAEAKALRVGKSTLECAVCLSEFEDDDRLRLLIPKCSHAFHPDCIGEWLDGHVTCPVCRCNLEPSHKDTGSSDGTIPLASSVSSETVAAAWQDGGSVPVAAVVIDVVTEEEEEEERRQEEAMELQRIGTQRRAMLSRSGHQPPTTAQLHSTGNSLAARLDRDMERFTLRLPESVSREMVAAASEHSLQLRRGGQRADRSEPLIGRPGRWQSLLGRTLSGKLSFFSTSRTMTPSSGDGEVSSSSSYSYTRLRGRRVAAVVDVAEVPAEGEGSTCHDRAGVGASGSNAKAAGAASSEVAAAADEEKAVKR